MGAGCVLLSGTETREIARVLAGLRSFGGVEVGVDVSVMDG